MAPRDFHRHVRGQSVQEAGGQLAYRVAFHGQPVLQWSNLGLLLEGAPPLGPAVRIESSQASSQDETWTAVQGKTSRIRNHYNAVSVETVETAANGRRLVVEARAYDDGVAFRYTVPSSLPSRNCASSTKPPSSASPSSPTPSL